MIVLDAYAVIAFLRGEPAAEQVRGLLEGGEEIRLTSTGLAEVIDNLVRRMGVDPEEAVLDVAQLGVGPAMQIDASTGQLAGLLRAQHFHARTREVSLADCVAAAAAQEAGARLATSDGPLLDLCHEEEIGYIVLPNSSGEVWAPGL